MSKKKCYVYILYVFRKYYMYINTICLKSEMSVAKNDTNKEIVDLLFPNLYKLLQAAASCKRSFSVMKRINTWIRHVQ